MTAPLRLTIRRSAGGGDGETPVQVRVDLPCDLDALEEAVELLALHCFAGSRAGDRTRFRFRVALAEALTNAVQAALRTGAAPRVAVQAELFPDRMRIAVTDQGAGFDPDALPDPTGPETLEREAGRGVFLIRQLTEAVEYNDRGNTIWMTLPRS